jgi:hypothetical protein
VSDVELPKSIADPIQIYHDACNRKISSACLRLPRLVQAEDELLRGVVEAVAKQDPVAFAKLAANEVDVRGLTFNDPDCATQFSGSIALTAAQHPAFIHCLAKVAVRVEAAPDQLSAPLLAYEPDVKLAVDVRDGVVQRIEPSPSSPSPSPSRPPPPPSSGSLKDPAPQAAPPTLSSLTADSNRIAGEKHIVPDDETKTAISLAGSPRLVGSFKLLITTHGTIAYVAMLRSTGSIAYDRTIERRLHGWKYRPFMIDGKPTLVWTAVTFIYTQH